MSEFVTKDSGQRQEYASGMVRDGEAGKARFDLLFPENVPYSAQMMTRFAELMARGAEKYDARNWEKASGLEELARYRSSATRHLAQWLAGETDEDHAAAVMFNLMAGETVKWKRANLPKTTAADILKPYIDKAMEAPCGRCGQASYVRSHWALATCNAEARLRGFEGVCAVPTSHHDFFVDFEVC